MLRLSFRLLFTLLLVLPLAACDSDGDGDGDGDGNGNGTNIGSSSVTVSGGFSSSFDGSAVFGVAEDGSSFSIGIFEGALPTSGNLNGELVAFGRNGDRPSPGTYSFDPSDMDFTAAYVSDFANTTSGTFLGSSSGTLTITSSSSDRVAGSFTFTGQAISGGGPVGAVTVAGTFSAEFATNVPSTGF
ncbi:MAG: hypothetical protein ABJF88_17480 [Rhodothermales bacterium]